MTTSQHIFAADAVGQFLQDLFGFDVQAADAPHEIESFGVSASYVNSEGKVMGHLVCDLEAAAKLGAALTQIPPGGVEDAIKSGALPDNLKENLHEVLNIAVNIMPVPPNQRLTLGEISYEAPTDLAETLDESSGVELKLARYGDCKIAAHYHK